MSDHYNAGSKFKVINNISEMRESNPGDCFIMTSPFHLWETLDTVTQLSSGYVPIRASETRLVLSKFYFDNKRFTYIYVLMNDAKRGWTNFKT